MEYKFKGVVDIETVLMNLYVSTLNSEKKYKPSPYTLRVLTLHNQGYAPSEIARHISLENKDFYAGQGLSTKITPQRVRQWLDRLSVEPNQENKLPRKKTEYKLMDNGQFRQLIINAMGKGTTPFEELRTNYNNRVYFTDGQFTEVKSKYVFDKLMDIARKQYLSK